MGGIRLIAFLLIIALILSLLPASVTAPLRVVFLETIGPLQGAAFEAAGDATATGGTLSEMFLDKERERALGGAVTKLRNDLIAAKQEARTLRQRLESVRKLKTDEISYETLSARVTGYDSVSTQRSVTIAAGSTDGVNEGQAVCALGAFVGQVEQVGPWRCQVKLITDPSSQIPCRLSSTGTICVAQGTAGRTLKVDWLDRHSPVKPGDSLVTARLESVGEGPALTPPGLPVANITETKRNKDDPLLMSVYAMPRVPTDRLEWVEIVMPSDQNSE